MAKKQSLLSSRLHRDSEVQASSTFERPHNVDKLFEPGEIQITKDSENPIKVVDRNVSKDVDINVSKDVSKDVSRNVSENNNVDISNDVNDDISSDRIIIVSKKKDDRDKLKRVSYYLKLSTDKLIAHNAKLAGLGKSEFLQGLLDKAFEKLEIRD